MPFHLQALHQATDFASLPAARWITAVFRRPDAVASAGKIQFDDYVLTLSTTSRSALSSNFESNFGPSREVVYDGSAVFSSLNATTPAGTKVFDLGVTSQKAFRYDPTAGNLLVDLRSSSGWDVPFRTDGQTTDYVSFVMNAGSSTAANANIAERWLPVHLFTFVPEPSALLLAGPLFAAALVHHRRLRRPLARGVAATLILALAMGAAEHGRAATLFYDDFEDGNFADHHPVSWSGDQGGSLQIEDGSLIVSGFGVPLAVPEVGPLTNVSIQVQFRILQGDYAGIAGRRTTGVRRGYFAAVGEYVNNGIPTNDAFLAYAGSLDMLHAKDVDFDPKLEDVILQLDIFGDTIAYWAWPADEPRPNAPIGKIVDDTLSSVSGGIYLWASSPGLSASKTGRAAFRYVHVSTTPIPEPGGLLLVGLAAAPWLAVARRRRFLGGRRLLAAFAAVAAGALCSGESSLAATVFVDDFQDGSATDGSPVTWTAFPNFPATAFDVQNGNLRLGASTPDAVGLIGVPTTVLGDTSIRARVRVQGESIASAAVFVRGTFGPPRSHALEVGVDGSLWLGIANNYQRIDSPLRPAEEDVILQLDAIGNSVKAWAWRAGDPKPAAPAFSFTTNLLPTGFPGVYCAPSDPPTGTSGTATYRYVHVATTPIPEPSTCVLVAVCGAAMTWRTLRCGHATVLLPARD